MQKNMTDRTPGSYDDFVAYLGTVRTEEELFSRLTYWFAGQNRPEDVLSRSELVEARAKELGFWQGLTFRMERWLTDGKSELEAVGREEFQSRIAEDYAAYREKADAAQARFRDRRRAAPFNFTPDCLENVPIQNVSWLVEGLLPMGEVSLLGADGGTGKGIWQAQLIAYVTAGRTSGFFPQPPGKTGSVLMMGRDKNSEKLYLSHEKSSYSAPARTALLHIEQAQVEGVKTAVAVFDSRTDKKDADFVEERRVRTAQTKEDTAQAILNVLAESKLGSMPSTQLRAEVMKEMGCSDRTYTRAYGELVKSGEVVKRQIIQKDGGHSWFSYLPHCGGLDGKVAI